MDDVRDNHLIKIVDPTDSDLEGGGVGAANIEEIDNQKKL